MVSKIDEIYAILKENDEQSHSLSYDLIKKLYEHLRKFPIKSLSTSEEVSELVKCVLRYVDCLMSFCFSVKVTRKNLLKVKIFFQCITDLFDSYEMKNVFISDASERIFNLILEPWIKPWYGKELLKVYNTVIHESSRKIRSDTLENLGLMYLYKFIDLLTVYGDYEFQTLILETIFRICDMNRLAILSSKLLPESELLSTAFMEIGSETFDDDARIFLNLLNNANSKIFSTICHKVELDDIEFEQSSTKGGKGIWVDFDMEELTLSWNCDTNALYQNNNNKTEDAETSSWENILLLNSGIEKIELSTVRVTVRHQMLLIILRINKNCISCTSNIQNVFESAKTLKLYVSDPEAINSLVEYVLPKFGQRPQMAGTSVASQGSNSNKRSQLSLNSNQPKFYVISDGLKSIHSDDTEIIKPEVYQNLYNFTASDQFSGASTSIVSLAPVMRNIDETSKVSVNSSIGNINEKKLFSTENLSDNLSQNNTIIHQYPEIIHFDQTQKDGNVAAGVDPDSDKVFFQVNEENKVSIIEQSAFSEENCDQNASLPKSAEHRTSLATDFDQIHNDISVIMKDNSFLNKPLKKCSEMTNKIQKNSLSKGFKKQKYKLKEKQQQILRKIGKTNISGKIDERLKISEEKDPKSKNAVVKPPFTFDDIYNRFCEGVNCAEEIFHGLYERTYHENEKDLSNKRSQSSLNSNQPMFHVISDGLKSIHSDDTEIMKPEVYQYLDDFTASDQFSGASTSIVSLAPVMRNIDETNKVSVNSSIGNINKKMLFSTENLSDNLNQNNTNDYQYPENIDFDQTQKDGNAAAGVDPDSDKLFFQVNEENKVSIIEQSASSGENCDQNASLPKSVEHRTSLATDFDQIYYDLTVTLKDNAFLNTALKKCSEMTNKIQKNSLSKGIKKQKYKLKEKQKQILRKINKTNISRKMDEMLKIFEEKDPESKNAKVKPPFTFDDIYNRLCEEVKGAEERFHKLYGRKYHKNEKDVTNEINPDDLKDLDKFPFTLDEILDSFKTEQPNQTDSKKTRSPKGKDRETLTHKAKKNTIKEITINKEVSTHTPSSKNRSRKRKLYDPDDLSYLTDISSTILDNSPVAVQKKTKVSTIREINETSSDTDCYISTKNLSEQNKISKDKHPKTNLRNNAIEVPSATKTSEECNPRIIILSDVVLQKPKQITPREPKVPTQRDEFNEISVLN